MNSFRFCLSGELVFHSTCVIISCIEHLLVEVSSFCLLSYEVPAENTQLIVSWWFPCTQLFFFSSLAVLDFSFSFNFQHLNYAFRYGFHLFHLVWKFVCFLDLDIFLLSQIRSVFSQIASNNFSANFISYSDFYGRFPNGEIGFEMTIVGEL